MNIVVIDNGTTLLNKLRVLIPGEEIVYGNDYPGLEDKVEDCDVLVLSGTSCGSLYANVA